LFEICPLAFLFARYLVGVTSLAVLYFRHLFINMGVPAFFRWLSCKYPSIVVSCIEEKKRVGDVEIPVNCCEPNPHGIEFDNFYLDMNGIIHPCCHPENKPAPANEEEMMVAIFEYIDRLFNIVRPRRLLYMAIDGVAPRAKMNQQRSRRFRASKEVEEKEMLIKARRQEMELQGIPLPPVDEKAEHFDSNCITPGTPFMSRLAECLRYYINDRLSSNPAWKDVAVILSDASVPGEGEHKIMDFIRRQRSSPSYDPNLQHVICGADGSNAFSFLHTLFRKSTSSAADLIMLGLATHEPNFTIIREEFVPNRPKPCDICGRYGRGTLPYALVVPFVVKFPFQTETQLPLMDTTFIFIRLSVLREYLKRDLEIPNLPFQYDFERVVDDWVFMCFFVGNDFLPHLPSLEIREGAIDRLIKLYKECVYRTGGYLTKHGYLNLARVQVILNELGAVEDEIFRHRQQNEASVHPRCELVFSKNLIQLQLDRARRAKSRRLRERAQMVPAYIPSNSFAPNVPSLNTVPVKMAREVAREMRIYNMTCEASRSGAREIVANSVIEAKVSKAVPTEVDEEEEPGANDEIRLWESGWKERYFLSKMQAGADEPTFRSRVAFHYVEGLCWVLRYYYQGCASWNWFYPFHYSPFASDFVNIGDLSIVFPEDTKPIPPFEQLMSVFPPASRMHLPPSWGELMIKPNSPIIDFYPTDFKIDLNGKRYAWQGVALLPFVDAKRLKEVLTTVYPDLSAEERKRNSEGTDILFVSTGHQVHSFIKALYEDDPYSNEWVQLDQSLSHGMSLEISRDPLMVPFGEVLISPLSNCPDIRDVKATRCIDEFIAYTLLSITYAYSCLMVNPRYPKGFVFPSKLLDGAKEALSVLKPQDWNERTDGRFWPTTGFTRGARRVSLSAVGHRILTTSLRSANNSLGVAQVAESSQYSCRRDSSFASDRYTSERSYSSRQLSARSQHMSEHYYGNKVAALLNHTAMNIVFVSALIQWTFDVNNFQITVHRKIGAGRHIFPAYGSYGGTPYPSRQPYHREQQHQQGSPYGYQPRYPSAPHSGSSQYQQRQQYDSRFYDHHSSRANGHQRNSGRRS
ncbi:hypothetical protein M513_04075, partial [Trichuris suis]